MPQNETPPAAHHRGDVPTPPELARRLAAGFHARGPAAAGPWLDPACGEGALLLAALEVHGGDPRVCCFGIEIDAEKLVRARERLARHAGLSPRDLEPNLLLADALDPSTTWPAGTHLLANPPWVSFSGRHADPGAQPAAHHRGPGGWPALHAAFLVRAARHLAQYGTEGRFLLPAPIATLDGYAPLRAAVDAHAHLVAAPELLPEEAFPGVHEPALLLHLGAGARDGAAAWSTPAPELDGSASAPLLDALAAFPRAPDGTFADPGLHTGNVAALLVFESDGPGRVPLRIGRDLRACALSPATRFLDTTVQAAPDRRFRRKTVAEYRSFPVLLRQTADRPIAALHEPGNAFRNSLLAAREIPGLDPAVLVAFLNSTVAARWHRANHADARQARFPQVKVGHLRHQPLPFVQRRDDPERHDELARRVRALHALSASDATSTEAAALRHAIEDLLRAAYGLPETLWPAHS